MMPGLDPESSMAISPPASQQLQHEEVRDRPSLKVILPKVNIQTFSPLRREEPEQTGKTL
jgi:hypothetical protein